MRTRLLQPFFLGPTNSGDSECLRFAIGTAQSESPSVYSRPPTAVELPREGRVVLVANKSIAVNGSVRKTSIMWRRTPVDQRMFSSLFLSLKVVVD